MTYDELYGKLTAGTISSVNELINAITASNVNNNLTANNTQTTTTNNTQPTTTTPTAEQTSAYKFEDWVKNKGYTYNYDPMSNQYKINDTAVASDLFNTLNNGYGTETQYNSILNSFSQTQNQLNQYKSQYDQQLQDLYSQLENYQGYQTPEELQQYLMEVLQSANQPFSYDPTQDTGLQQAQSAAGMAVREAAGAKGTLYSSGTISNVAKQQGALIPQYEEKAYSRYSDAQNRKIQLATTLMQWDQMQADRSKDQLDIIKSKYEYIMALDAQDFEEFKVALDQQNWQKEYQLQQQQFELEKKLQEIENAYKRVDALGYVDNTTSVILGLPVGTKAQWAAELELQQKQQLEQMKQEQANAIKLQQEQAKIDKDLLDYKSKLDLANQKTAMAKQYEYDKSLAKYKSELEMSSLTGASGIISNAKSYLGTPYVYGGNSKTKGLDCSALSQQVMAQAGVTLPRTAYEQSKVGTKVAWSDLQPGDLVFFDTIGGNGKNVDHVGIYVGNGQMIHASSGSGKVVQVSINTSYWQGKFTVARRNLPGSGSYSTGSSSSSGSTAKIGKNATSTSTSTIQQYLRNYGIGVTVDGKYGADTTAAVINFQKSKGLTPDGIVGPATLAALKKYATKPAATKLPYI